MDSKDYSELLFLMKGAETALLSGELTDWQHACTSTFHLLSQFILDLNERCIACGETAVRLATAYPSTNQSMECAKDAIEGL